MADKKEIAINAKVEINLGAAEQAMKKITDQFKSIEKTSFNKMNEDFRKLAPLIKTLDKDLHSMMNTMSKKDAGDQLKKMNDALLQQSKMLKDNTEEYKKLTEQIALAADEAEKLELKNKRSAVAETNRAIMTKMEEHAERRDEAKKVLGEGKGITPGGALMIAGIAQVAKQLANATTEYMGSLEARRASYTAQAEAPKQDLLRGVTSGKLDTGIFMATGGHKKAMEIAAEQYSSAHKQIITSAMFDSISGALVGSVGGPGGAVAGAVAGISKNINTRVVDQLSTTLGDVSKAAEFAGYYQKAKSDIQQSTAPFTEFANERIARSRARLGGLQQAGGTERETMGNIEQAAGPGFRYLEDEALGMIGMQGRGAGLIGGERRNITPLMEAERAQVMSAGEFTGLEKRGAGVTAQSRNTAKMIREAVLEGTKTGIDKSMIRDFTESALHLVEMGSSRTESLVPTLELIEKALGGRQAEEVGGAEIKAATSAVEQYQNLQRGAGTAMMTGIQIGEVNKALDKAGGGSISVPARLRMATMTPDQIRNSPNLIAQLTDAGVNVEEFLKDLEERKATATLAPMVEKSSALQGLLSSEKRKGFQKELEGLQSKKPEDLTDKERARLQKLKQQQYQFKDIAAIMAPEGSNREDYAEGLANVYGIGKGPLEGGGWNMITGRRDTKGPGGLESAVEGTAAMQGAGVEAKAEQKRREFSFSPEANKIIADAIVNIDALAKEMIKPGKAMMGFENGIGTLNTNMDTLTKAIQANTDAITGQNMGPPETTKEEPGAKKMVPRFFR